MGGANLSKADREAVGQIEAHLNSLSPMTHPNTFSWYRLVSKFTSDVRAKW